MDTNQDVSVTSLVTKSSIFKASTTIIGKLMNLFPDGSWIAFAIDRYRITTCGQTLCVNNKALLVNYVHWTSFPGGISVGRTSQSTFTQDFRGEPLGHKLSWRLFFHFSSALILLLVKPQYILFSRTGVWPIESVQVGKVSCTDEIRTSDLHVRTLRHYPLDHGCPKCVFVFVNKWISKINVTR